MANRSYLYASNVKPIADNKEQLKFQCVSEANYCIPLVYLILISDNVESNASSIWELDEEIAIIGGFEKGRERLFTFFRQVEERMAEHNVENDDIVQAMNDARNYLSKPELNDSQYFVLEPGEIYDLVGDDFTQQNQSLLAEAKNYQTQIDHILEQIGKVDISALDEDHYIGFASCYWSHILYFDLS